MTLVLPQNVFERLGLELQGTAFVTDADERREARPRAGRVTVWRAGTQGGYPCCRGSLWQPSAQPCSAAPPPKHKRLRGSRFRASSPSLTSAQLQYVLAVADLNRDGRDDILAGGHADYTFGATPEERFTQDDAARVCERGER